MRWRIVALIAAAVGVVSLLVIALLSTKGIDYEEAMAPRPVSSEPPTEPLKGSPPPLAPRVTQAYQGVPMGGEASGPSLGVTLPSAPTHLPVALKRKLIWEAWLSLLTSEVTKTLQQARDIVEQMGGYTAYLSQTRSPEGEWLATAIFRVPSTRYKEAITRLQQLGQVEALQEQVQDVTEEYLDIEARLRNLKRLEEHLLAMIKRAKKISDLLELEREISMRRQEIERIEGRLRWLEHQTAFSSIHVTFKEFRARPVPETAFSVPKVFADAFRTVVIIWQQILVAVIWFLVFGILWVPGVLVLGGIARVVRKRLTPRALPTETAGSQ